jgi:hypothetical protein
MDLWKHHKHLIWITIIERFILSLRRGEGLITQIPDNLYKCLVPITEKGRYLFVWSGPGTATPVFIPYGHMLLLRGDVVHAGGLPRGINHSGKEYDRIHFYLPNYGTDVNQGKICLVDSSGNLFDDKYKFP